jgi:hypothetical protein
VRVSATDGEGNTLTLEQAAETDLHPELLLALAKNEHFAIPDAGLIIQLTPQNSHPAGDQTPVLVQAYRYPPVQLETESVVQGDADLQIGDVTLHLAGAPYVQATVTFNPGLWPTGIGVALIIVGLGGSIIRPTRPSKMRKDVQVGEED